MRHLTPKDLRGYQRRLGKLIVDRPFVFLAAEMAIGKTATTLLALRELLDQFAVAQVLVIAPKLVAEETWPSEIKTWSFSAPLTFEVLTGSVERRECRARVEADIHIINRENVPWLVEFWGSDWPYDMVVVDEFSSFKNPRKRSEPTKRAIEKAHDAARQQIGKNATESEFEVVLKRELRKLKRNPTRFGALCKARRYIDRMVGLTGTPSPNGLLDLWSQTYLLDLGERLGATFKAYRDRWFVSDYMGYNYTPRPGAPEEIMSKLSDIMVSLRTADYVELPDAVYNTVEVTLPKKVMDEYQRFKRTLVAEEYDVTADSKGILANKLLQFANGSLYNEDGDDVWVHDAKLDALARIVEEAAGDPVLVAYSYQFDLERIRKKFPRAVMLAEEPGAVEKWNRGEIPLAIGHPQSIGHGLNLQYGGHIAVWYGLPWALEYYLQFNRRLARPGQKRTVFIHHIVAEGTVDMDVLPALAAKESTQDDVMAAVKFEA